MSDRAPWATLDDVRRMIARTELKQALNGRPYLVPPQETRPPGACSKHEYAVGPDGYCEGCRPTPTTSADDRSGARAGATSGETGGTLCTCRCTCSVGVVSRHCNVHGSPYYLTCPLHFAQPQTEDMKRIFELIKPEDCPDSGPAKEAASPDSSRAGFTPAPQRGTATGALTSVEEAARWIVRDFTCADCDRDDMRTAILALVNREREAALSRFADEIVKVFSSQNATAPERDILEYVKAARDRELAR